MKPSLLDTDTLSYYLRSDKDVVPSFERYFAEFGVINLSVITDYEIRSGLLVKDAKKRLKQYFELLRAVKLIAIDGDVSGLAAEIQARLLRKGRPVGEFDILIAATALTHNLVLVTNNVDHFQLIQSVQLPLAIQNWKRS